MGRRARCRPNPEEVIGKFADGISINTMCKEYGATDFIIRKIILAAGLRPRTQSEAGIVRTSKMSKSELEHQFRFARESLTGKKQSRSTTNKRAVTRRNRLVRIGKFEDEIYNYLANNNFIVKRQEAVGSFNVDLSVRKVAIEIWKCTNHPTRKVNKPKNDYLIKRGWRTIWLWYSPKQKNLQTTNPDTLTALLLALRSKDKTSIIKNSAI